MNVLHVVKKVGLYIVRNCYTLYWKDRDPYHRVDASDKVDFVSFSGDDPWYISLSF